MPVDVTEREHAKAVVHPARARGRKWNAHGNMQVVNEIAWASLGSLGKEEDKQGTLGTSPRHSEIVKGRKREGRMGMRMGTGMRRGRGKGTDGNRDWEYKGVDREGPGKIGDRMGQRDRQEQGLEIQGVDGDKAGE
ncbi:hypothetical protein B0H17DRAFT_1147114 [Mycena rosella]|uniref:Uncharacterized protein n=1 Tax=Mycena rosella TaxID=1033263 RepID=A0AAD7G053_MYCRO|nr:hypothetical protein B0H17DRAFT_1147114 [Mycena rosella]